MGGGVEATATNRSSTIYLQRFSAHATCGPRARKPWVLRDSTRSAGAEIAALRVSDGIQFSYLADLRSGVRWLNSQGLELGPRTNSAFSALSI